VFLLLLDHKTSSKEDMYVLVVVLNPAQSERFSQLLGGGGGEFPGLRSSWGRLDS
jgi:hypothetical protein